MAASALHDQGTGSPSHRLRVAPGLSQTRRSIADLCSDHRSFLFPALTSIWRPNGDGGKSRSRLPDGTSQRQIICHFLPVSSPTTVIETETCTGEVLLVVLVRTHNLAFSCGTSSEETSTCAPNGFHRTCSGGTTTGLLPQRVPRMVSTGPAPVGPQLACYPNVRPEWFPPDLLRWDHNWPATPTGARMVSTGPAPVGPQLACYPNGRPEWFPPDLLRWDHNWPATQAIPSHP